MLRVRLFRLLLPALLLLLGAVIAYNLKPFGRVHGELQGREHTPTAETLAFEEWTGAERSVAGHVDLLQDSEDGSLHLEGIRNLEITREGRETLEVSARRGDRDGAAGSRVWRFAEQVVFHDPEQELELSLPVLEVDEAAGEARSSGEIHLAGAQLKGRAASLVWGLRGQPGRLDRPDFIDAAGRRVVAREATLWDGLRDIELIGEVQATHADQRLESGRIRIKRGPDDRLHSIDGRDRVRGQWRPGSAAAAEFQARHLFADFDARGDVLHVELEGDAALRRGAESLAAPRISARRRSDRPGWEVRAVETAEAQGTFQGGPARLRAERFEAVLDPAFRLEQAEAWDQVSFEGAVTRAEAAHATFDTVRAGEIQLDGDEKRKARLADGRLRLAAERIVTQVGGSRLDATGRVEASLLTGDAGGIVSGRQRLFAAAEALHFVSGELHGEDGGQRLVFDGAVRAWQGERNLSAEHVALDQRNSTIAAEGQVATRFPRETGVATVSEADYVLIEAGRLDYSDRAGHAVYEGAVRLRFAEGWLEARRMEVELGEEGRGIRQVVAEGEVVLEVRSAPEGQAAEPITGRADRLVYRPTESSLRLFGQATPATVRRVSGGATTSGRVLLYRLDLGTLEVDSGEQGPASIRTSEH